MSSEARDGAAERIACGAGSDEARNDFTDIIAECERGPDGDGDGFAAASTARRQRRDPAGRLGGLRQRHRRELQRP